MTGIKILSLICFLAAIIVLVLYFLKSLGFEPSALLLLGDIAIYNTGSVLVA